jgi:hypothetical protein
MAGVGASDEKLASDFSRQGYGVKSLEHDAQIRLNASCFGWE